MSVKILSIFVPKYRKFAKQLEADKKNNTIYIREKFNDFESFKEAALKWSLDFNQLDSGKFKGEMILMDLGDLHILSAKLNRHFDQRGTTPSGYRTFAVPADNNQAFKWRGYDVTSKNVMLFPKSGEIDAITYPGFNVFTISIADEIIERFKSDNPNMPDKETEVIELASQSANVLRNQLKYLISQANLHPDKIHSKAFQKIFTDEVPSLLLSNLTDYKSSPKLPPKRIRDISLNKAVDYLQACKVEMPTVRELCLIAGASQRTLEYGFKGKYGIGPKDYMKKQRLNLVHKALINADPSQLRIKDIAYKFGFWHLGQFGADYKKMFQERPSETLIIGK